MVHLEHLYCDGLRNLADVDLVAGRHRTLIVGDNGQGKTNLLEAIHLAASLRPLKPVERHSDLVGEGRGHAVIRARFEAAGPLPVELVIEPKGKRATMAGKTIKDASELWRQVGVVSFLPDDNAIVRGAPELRRRALDRVAFSLDAGFAGVAKRFEDALDRRNRVLKAARVDLALLLSYDEPYAAAAAALSLARARAAQRLGPCFAAEARAIGGDALAASLRYQSAVDDDLGDDPGAGSEESLAAALRERLHLARELELKRRTTAHGPHHDDVAILKADRKARFLASQGEARALGRALKLAQVRLVSETRGAGPLLLLDDVAGELDPERAARLFHAADETGAQTFVTTTHAEALPELRHATRVRMQAGHLFAEDRP
ncbi:MAG: DNA replication and repair protein RecF [Deltaproteobacteria bacterium]|nr:DNA replication and repair protein RecF [Deltaproteobacteria bacterium]